MKNVVKRCAGSTRHVDDAVLATDFATVAPPGRRRPRPPSASLRQRSAGNRRGGHGPMPPLNGLLLDFIVWYLVASPDD